jgi:hypothetical protein
LNTSTKLNREATLDSFTSCTPRRLEPSKFSTQLDHSASDPPIALIRDLSLLPMTTTTTITATGRLEGVQTNSATKYVVKHATTRAEMDGIMDVIWAANYTPYEPFVQLVFPVLGFLPQHREAAIAESKERFWINHQSDPSVNWYYIEEFESGKAVGCAQWEIHLKNPLANGPPTLQAPWWPEGEYRDFCELILNQTYKARASWMARPHVGEHDSLQPLSASRFPFLYPVRPFVNTGQKVALRWKHFHLSLCSI